MPYSIPRHFTMVGLAMAVLISAGDHLPAVDSPAGERSLSTDDLLKVINDEDWILVDTRATDAYNGWALDGVRRGGHLPGAVDFPAGWLDVDAEDRTRRLQAALRTKGIEAEKHVVLYSTKKADRRRVASYLREAGFRQLYSYDIRDWAEDERRALTRYENFRLLVPAPIVKLLLDGRSPETFEDAKRVKFVEVSWGNEGASYAKGHVPRSFHVNTDHFEPPPRWKLGDPDVLSRFAAKYGFQVDDTVIISGEDPTASYRLSVVLQYMGVRDARVLNGGFAAWKAAGYPVETRSVAPPGAPSFGARIPVRPALIDDATRVTAGLRNPGEFVLVDTRTWAEFIGETSGYEYHSHKGRIPGSTYGQAGFTGANSLTPYRNIDNTMRNADEILALWRRSGIGMKKHLSLMCGGGWRAAEVLTYARVIGIENTSLYSDGWIGWSDDESLPVVSGAPSEKPKSVPARERTALSTETDWPWWRGPNHNGIASDRQKPPHEWSASKNILWKSPVPGRGHGSPIVVGKQVVLVTADLKRDVQTMLCYDRDSGELVWKTDVHTGGVFKGGNQKATQASTTPACDGERFFVNLLNKNAIYTTALSRSGKKLWQRKISDYVVHQGYGSSPFIYKSLILVSADNKGGGAVCALKRDSGDVVWRVDRPKKPNYPSPVVMRVAGREQLLLSGCDLVSSFDPLTGKKLWEIEGATTECVTTTVTDGKLIFTSGGYPRNHVSAVRADGSGEVVWTNGVRVYVPSMIVADGYLYGVTDAGVATCWNSSTGKNQWKGRLGGTFTSSPILAAGHIFATNERGKSFVFKASPTGFELVATNEIHGEVFATPAICDSRVYLRFAERRDGKRREMICCIGKP